ncbi:hypothetical protein PV08_06947 [Exophiala spinifera]|uniref:DUF7924 domain-containing protein n=1 Tax=Exophiala spinifera TaxID=91928 RepID=A0A0D1YGQ2_9EURO|nr:uncharacterized protein PV08_06947 [Exophiala spinifera]KIW14166.1 hypothetical protein PV08_06947 [Exophiala spinifera]
MTTRAALRETPGRRRGRDIRGRQQAQPDDSSRKRRRPLRDGHEGADTIEPEHRRKSRRIQERCQFLALATTPTPHEHVADSAAAAGKPPLQATTTTCSLKRQAAKQRRTTSGSLPRPSPPRSVHIEGQPHDTEDPSSRPIQQAQTSAGDKENFIQEWLERSSWSRISDLSANMPHEPVPALPSPGKSPESMLSASRKSEKSVASVPDANYRQSLKFRRIYIESDDPPAELMQRAKRIISRSRAPPEMDDATVQDVRAKSRRLASAPEETITQQLASDLIPSMNSLPDARLCSSRNQLWYNSVPVPLDSSLLTNPLPLPKPKPDLVFGYSETAFTRNQRATIELLIDDQFGRSYAIPDENVHFPFLEIEFRSQAKNGTHYVATNQAAGAGAIALHGRMDLTQRSSRIQTFEYNEPQYFSVSMDHQLAQINVHWDPQGIRALSRAIKNILDEATDSRLRTLCSALDAYREIVARKRDFANANSQRAQGQQKTPSEPQSARRSVEMHPPELPASTIRHGEAANAQGAQRRHHCSAEP